MVDGRLSFGEGGKMKLDRDPFQVNVIDFEGKKVLIREDQKETTKGKKCSLHWWDQDKDDQAQEPWSQCVESEWEEEVSFCV